MIFLHEKHTGNFILAVFLIEVLTFKSHWFYECHLQEKFCILIQFSGMLIPKGPIDMATLAEALSTIDLSKFQFLHILSWYIKNWLIIHTLVRGAMTLTWPYYLLKLPVMMLGNWIVSRPWDLDCLVRRWNLQVCLLCLWAEKGLKHVNYSCNHKSMYWCKATVYPMKTLQSHTNPSK